MNKHFPGDEGRRRGAVPSPPFSAEATNVLRCTSTPTQAFMAPCLTERGGKLRFLADISWVNTVNIVKD